MSGNRQHVQEMQFRTQEDLQTLLILYRDSIGLLWSEIAKKEPFNAIENIPLSTLHYIYSSGKVPKHYWKILRVVGSQPPRIAISKEDMESACSSITNNLPIEKIRTLYDLLTVYLQERED